MNDSPHLDQAADTALIQWTWQRGGNAVVVDSDGVTLTVHSTIAYPPGAPLNAISQSGVAFEMKVRSCKKSTAGTFEITGKLVNATRPLRATLVAAVNTAKQP